MDNTIELIWKKINKNNTIYYWIKYVLWYNVLILKKIVDKWLYKQIIYKSLVFNNKNEITYNDNIINKLENLWMKISSKQITKNWKNISLDKRIIVEIITLFNNNINSNLEYIKWKTFLLDIKDISKVIIFSLKNIIEEKYSSISDEILIVFKYMILENIEKNNKFINIVFNAISIILDYIDNETKQ